MYDDLAGVYDRFIDWPTRLARELPLLEAWLGDARRVADVACGTGAHARALAAGGREVVGFDPSGPALARARAAGGGARFVQASYGELAATGEPPFEALYSLGNSLPHVLTLRGLRRTLADCARVLVPGGRLLLGLRNLALTERWLPLRAHRDADGTEWLFDRFYDFRPRGRLEFQFVVHWRAPGEAWRRELHSTPLRAWSAETLVRELAAWQQVRLASDLAGGAFDPAHSTDLFVTARRPVVGA